MIGQGRFLGFLGFPASVELSGIFYSWCIGLELLG
jgi:hypothetical protein